MAWSSFRSVATNVGAWWPLWLAAAAVVALRNLLGPPESPAEAGLRALADGLLVNALAFGMALPDGRVRRRPALTWSLLASTAVLAAAAGLLAAAGQAFGAPAEFASVLFGFVLLGAVGTMPAIALARGLAPAAAAAASFRGLAGQRASTVGASLLLIVLGAALIFPWVLAPALLPLPEAASLSARIGRDILASAHSSACTATLLTGIAGERAPPAEGPPAAAPATA